MGTVLSCTKVPNQAQSVIKGKHFISENKMSQQIDKFYANQITKKQFITDLFPVFQSYDHPLGKLHICNSYLLQRFYYILAEKSDQQQVNKDKLKFACQKIYLDPEKAIDYSFMLLDINKTQRISNSQFLNFMDNCFISLSFNVEKSIEEPEFRVAFREWIEMNKNKVLRELLNVFKNYTKVSPDYWTFGDYKKFIYSGQYWTFDIGIGNRIYKTPLNLLSLLGISYF